MAHHSLPIWRTRCKSVQCVSERDWCALPPLRGLTHAACNSERTTSSQRRNKTQIWIESSGCWSERTSLQQEREKGETIETVTLLHHVTRSVNTWTCEKVKLRHELLAAESSPGNALRKLFFLLNKSHISHITTTDSQIFGFNVTDLHKVKQNIEEESNLLFFYFFCYINNS